MAPPPRAILRSRHGRACSVALAHRAATKVGRESAVSLAGWLAWWDVVGCEVGRRQRKSVPCRRQRPWRRSFDGLERWCLATAPMQHCYRCQLGLRCHRLAQRIGSQREARRPRRTGRPLR
eukprot:scaffold25353_cov62-Phaeocystis_antarctica.AAC.2